MSDLNDFKIKKADLFLLKISQILERERKSFLRKEAYNHTSKASNIMCFVYFYVGNSTSIKTVHVHPFEVFVVAGICVAWLCSIAIFVKKWNGIQISTPVESRCQPKNIHKIKVCFPTDFR